jgi:hypothetical protein
VLKGRTVGTLVLQGTMITFEHRDEQREGQERVRPHLEQGHVIVLAQRSTLVLVEGQPGAPLIAVAVEDPVGHLGLPPGHRAGRIGPVALDELWIAVDGEQELVQQVLAHDAGPPITEPVAVTGPIPSDTR